MLELLYRSRCWLALAMICLLAACNVKSDMDNMERLVMEIENKFERGEDISQDTSIFQARSYFDLSDDQHNSAPSNTTTSRSTLRATLTWNRSTPRTWKPAGRNTGTTSGR